MNRANRWISVNDEVPDANYSVLVNVVGGPIHMGEDYLEVASFINGRWMTTDIRRAADTGVVDDCEIQVSHWMHPEIPAQVTA
jgi:hypothetical protein